MIKVRNIDTGVIFEVPLEHWEEVLENQGKYKRVEERKAPSRKKATRKKAIK